VTNLRAIMVCVDYEDLLAVTLPYNRRHFSEVWVVTNSITDGATARVARLFDARLFHTDAFYRNGADFNKWLALEEGLDAMGRSGWLCIMDADILIPKGVRIGAYGKDGVSLTVANGTRATVLAPGNLCTPLRHMSPLTPPVPHEESWPQYPIHPNQGEFAGYMQIFHADDPALGTPPFNALNNPWYETNWRHAGGADSFFQRKWSREKKLRPPFNVMHVGTTGINWCGRAQPYVDGTSPQEAVERVLKVRKYITGRVADPQHRFDGEKLLD